jgi:hypothetical protein
MQSKSKKKENLKAKNMIIILDLSKEVPKAVMRWISLKTILVKKQLRKSRIT